MKKRILFLILTVVALVSVCVFAVQAETDEVSRLNAISAQLEKQPLDFSDGNIPVCPYCGTAPESWQVLGKCTKTTKLSGNAHYYLAEDQVSNTHYYNIVADANICLYLNGKDILSTRRAFYVAGGGTLTIMGTKESTVSGTAVDETDVRGIALDTSGGTFNVLGGTYPQIASRSVAFLRTANSVLNIYEGTLFQGDPEQKSPVVKLDAKNCKLNMYGGEITGGRAAGNGGNIYTSGSGIEVNIMGGKVTNGTANSGGNISAGSGATVKISGNAEISGGTATGSYSRGGNIFVGGSCNLIITGGTIKDGRSETVEESRGGGNIHLYGGDMTMSGGVVENGTSAIYGGNLFMCNGSVATITGGILTGGTAVGGGNVCVGVFTESTGDDYKTTLNLAGGTVTGGVANTEDLGGGNILVIGNVDNTTTLPTVNLSDGTVTAGTSTYSGGNIHITRGVLNMTGGVISNGNASNNAGNLYLGNSTTQAHISGGTITGGTCGGKGGNIYTASYSLILNLTGGEITKGTAGTDGGNLYVNNGMITLDGGRITDGEAKNGGNIMAGGAQDQVALGAVTISGGTANKGKDINLKSTCHLLVKKNFASECYMYVHSAHLTDGAVLAEADTCEGSFPGKLYLENKENMPIYGVAGDTALYIGGAMLIRDGKTTWFTDNAEAVAAYDGADYLRVMAGELVLTGGDYVVDLAGNPVTVTGSGTVTVFDSGNDQFTACGSVTLDGPTLKNTRQYTHDGKIYMTLSENGTYSFHHLQMQFTGVALRPGNAGVYYKCQWNCDDALMAQLQSAGVAVSLAHTPDGNFASDEETLYTAMDAASLTRGESFTSAIIDNIFAADAENNALRGMMDIHAVPYVTLKNGDTVVGGHVAYSLYDVLKLMDQQAFYKEHKAALETFAAAWQEAMTDWNFENIGVKSTDDSTLRILMVGNSFCYYYVEELYALFAENMPEGIEEVEIYNLYYSGCKLNQHLQWWQEGTAKYDYYCTDKNGRVLLGEKGTWTLEAALALGDWDYISLQNGSATYAVDDIETAAQTYIQQAGPLLNRFHELFPDAQLLWQRTWAFEVGRVSGSTTYTEKMLVEYDQNAQYVSDLICETYADLGIIPVNSGIAWRNARQLDAQREKSLLPYGGLCARLGYSKFGDLRKHSGDGYHDGDIGGAQLLNAYMWYMTITGDYDLSDSTYAPVYTYSGTEYTLSSDHIALLKEAAEQTWK